MVEGGSELDDLDEVVEVTGLEAGILTVVHEGQKLARLGRDAVCAGGAKGTNDARGDDADRAGATLFVEGDQLGELAGPQALVGDPALEAEPERSWDERGHDSALGLSGAGDLAGNEVPGRRDQDAARHVTTTGRNDRVARLTGAPREGQAVLGHGIDRPLALGGEEQVAVALVRGAHVVPGDEMAAVAVLGDSDHEVVLAALPAEGERVETFFRVELGVLLGRQDGQLVVRGDVPDRRQLRRDVDGSAFGQELMQAEGEQGSSSRLVLSGRAGEQGSPECIAAGLFVLSGDRTELLCGVLDRRGRASHEPVGLRLLGDPERVLNPRRHRVVHQIGVAQGGCVLNLTARPGCLGERRCVRVADSRRPDKCLDDDPLRGDRRPEDAGRDGRNILLLLVNGRPAGHRGRRADALKRPARARQLTDAADEHGHISALPAAIRVELVKDQKLEVGGVLLEEAALLRPGEHQLEHHVVGQQDVRRVLEDLLTRLAVLLAGVTAIRHRRLLEADPEELVQLFDLAVRKGIHRVDDDGPDPLAAAVSQDAVDNRDHVCQRLARARARREDIRPAGSGGRDRGALVFVERKRGGCLARALRREGDPAVRVKQPGAYQLINPAAGRERRVQREPRVWPLGTLEALLLDGLPQPGVTDVDEPFGERAVVVDQLPMNSKRVH